MIPYSTLFFIHAASPQLPCLPSIASVCSCLGWVELSSFLRGNSQRACGRIRLEFSVSRALLRRDQTALPLGLSILSLVLLFGATILLLISVVALFLLKWSAGHLCRDQVLEASLISFLFIIAFWFSNSHIPVHLSAPVRARTGAPGSYVGLSR